MIPFSVIYYYNYSYILRSQCFRKGTSEMQLLKPEPDHSPTTIAKQYGTAKLQLSRHSAYSLEKFAI